jgi:DNA-binding transcriptional regulator of glucitol operon
VDRKFLRPGWIVGHLLVVLAVLVCLRLGRWQWDRMHEGGTIQNLGYAVLWPVFGAAFIYMWFRFLQLEKLKDAEDEAELTALASGGASAPVAGSGGDEASGQAPALDLVAGDLPAAVDPVPPPGPVRSAQPAPVAGDAAAPGLPAPPATSDGDHPAPSPRVSRNTPSTGVTVAVATVGGDDENDPELAAYNRALAALAEKDH